MAEETPAPATEAEAPAGEQATEEPLGPAGEKALDEWKKRARTAEKEAKRAAELESELNTYREQAMSEQEKAIAKAREEAAAAARDEVLGEVRRERLENAVVRAATGKLNDPDDAVRFLNLEDIEDGDAEAISAAIAGLIESKPYLAAGATRQLGSADQGPRPAPESSASTDMNQLLRAAVTGR